MSLNYRDSSAESTRRLWQNVMKLDFSATQAIPMDKQSELNYSEKTIKADMVDAFEKLNLTTYSDILRIKKPQVQACVATQMLCRLVNAFRGGKLRQRSGDINFDNWSTMQDFVHRKPNVIKFNQELTHLIKETILSQGYLKQVKSGQLECHVQKLVEIHKSYFADKCK
jgi:hypothetical protein